MSPIASPAAIRQIKTFRAKGATVTFSDSGPVLAYVIAEGAYLHLMPDGTVVDTGWDDEPEDDTEAAIERANDEWASRECCPWWAQ
jgi:hypothetical protein